MKAKIIRQKVYDGMMDWSHGGGHEIKRLVVEEADNIAITLAQNRVYVFTYFKLQDKTTFPEQEPKVIGEIEVPDKLVEKALAVVRAPGGTR